MKEHPIIFSSEMVRAILEGRKTQTRRIIKPQPKDMLRGFCIHTWPGKRLGQCCSDCKPKCKYGLEGDRLWVRETFGSAVRMLGGGTPHKFTAYKADYEKRPYCYDCDGNPCGKVKWKPSIYMPRWASRITLEIKDISVQRIQDITEDDAKAEGVKSREAFIKLWNKINEKRGYGWDANPWVWVVEFEKI